MTKPTIGDDERGWLHAGRLDWHLQVLDRRYQNLDIAVGILCGLVSTIAQPAKPSFDNIPDELQKEFDRFQWVADQLRGELDILRDDVAAARQTR